MLNFRRGSTSQGNEEDPHFMEEMPEEGWGGVSAAKVPSPGQVAKALMHSNGNGHAVTNGNGHGNFRGYGVQQTDSPMAQILSSGGHHVAVAESDMSDQFADKDPDTHERRPGTALWRRLLKQVQVATQDLSPSVVVLLLCTVLLLLAVSAPGRKITSGYVAMLLACASWCDGVFSVLTRAGAERPPGVLYAEPR